MTNIKAGPSADPEENALRGVFVSAHAERQASLISDALEKGAKLVVGDASSATHNGGNVVQPTVLDHIKPGMSTLILSLSPFRTHPDDFCH